MALENLFFRTQRSIGGVPLDATIREGHTSTARITSSPVEFGPDVSDGVIIEPSSLVIRGVVSDTPLGIAALGTFVDAIARVFGAEIDRGGTRSQKAFAAMEALKNAREPIVVSTKLKEYRNMLIASVSCGQDSGSSSIADMKITLSEVFITGSEIIEIEKSDIADDLAASVTPNKDRGKIGTIEVVGEKETSWAATGADWTLGR